jgi:hypothetical protein
MEKFIIKGGISIQALNAQIHSEFPASAPASTIKLSAPYIQMPIWRSTRPSGLALGAAEQSSRSAGDPGYGESRQIGLHPGALHIIGGKSDSALAHARTLLGTGSVS